MKLSHILKNYEPVSLISAISSMMLDNRNMELFLTLQQAQHIAIKASKKSTSNTKVLTNINQLISQINKCEETSSISHLQDPAEELFTDNVLCHGGNYVVFPGITSGGVYTLDLLLKSAFSKSSALFENNKDLLNMTLSLLKLSDEIASRASIKAWEKYPRSQTRYNNVSRSLNSKLLKSSVVFSSNELQEILYPEEYKELLKLSVPIESYPEDDFNPESCLLSLKPIIKCGEIFVVADPSGIVSCIRNEILSYYTSDKTNRLRLLSEIKRAELSNLNQNFMLLGFDKIGTEVLKGEKPDYYDELIFSLDSKRICFVQVLFDNLEKYDSTIAFPYVESKDEFKFIEDRLKEYHEKLFSVIFKDFEILHILVQVPMGRTTVGGFNYVPPNTSSINFSSPDLNVVAGLKLTDKYLLYNFASAIEELRKRKVFIQSFSHLDMLQSFLSCNQSFYMSDDFKPTMINFSTDFGRSLREEKADKEQKQNAYHYTGSLFPVMKKYIDGNIPIFVSLNSVKFGYEELVKNDSYIWCKVETKSDQIPGFQFTEALAYWTWQITKEISNKLPSCLIELSFSNDFIKSFENHKIPELTIEKDSIIAKQDIHDYILIDAQKPVIKLELQKNAIGLLFFSKNEFDRCLVKALLSIFDVIMNDSQEDEDILNLNVDKVAPYGDKKILTIQSSTSSPYLLENPTRRKIKISEYFSGKYLDELGEKIKSDFFKNVPNYGQIAPNERRRLQEICKNFYKDKLDSLLSKYDSKDLLKSLFEVNENLIYQERMDNAHFFTSIACYYSIHEKIKKDQQVNSLKQTTSLCNRFLIEYVYCTNNSGNEKIDELELQELLSVAGQYVSWGIATDELRCNVFDHQYSYLKSDRIGLSDSAKTGMMGFANKKIEEETISRYSKNLKSIHTRDNHYDAFKKAFEAEYSIPYTHFVNIVGDICGLTSINKRNTILKSEILNIDNEYSEKEKITTLNLLTLPLRDSWNEIPEENLPHEILPWRFKRRLSCIQKPILISNNEQEDTEYYIYQNTILRAVEYIFHQFISAGFPSDYFSSKVMRSFIGSVAKDLGKMFEDEVKLWIESIPNENIRVFSGVEIGPNHRFKNDDNIGDIDHLIINEKRKEIIVMELKAISGSKTPVEISTEIRKHFQNDDPPKKTSLEKHLTRYNWVKNNLVYVIEELKLTKNKYKVFQVFVTDETIPSTFLKTLPKNVASFERFRWHKYSEFRKCYK